MAPQLAEFCEGMGRLAGVKAAFAEHYRFLCDAASRPTPRFAALVANAVTERAQVATRHVREELGPGAGGAPALTLVAIAVRSHNPAADFVELEKRLLRNGPLLKMQFADLATLVITKLHEPPQPAQIRGVDATFAFDSPPGAAGAGAPYHWEFEAAVDSWTAVPGRAYVSTNRLTRAVAGVRDYRVLWPLVQGPTDSYQLLVNVFAADSPEGRERIAQNSLQFAGHIADLAGLPGGLLSLVP